MKKQNFSLNINKIRLATYFILIDKFEALIEYFYCNITLNKYLELYFLLSHDEKLLFNQYVNKNYKVA